MKRKFLRTSSRSRGGARGSRHMARGSDSLTELRWKALQGHELRGMLADSHQGGNDLHMETRIGRNGASVLLGGCHYGPRVEGERVRVANERSKRHQGAGTESTFSIGPGQRAGSDDEKGGRRMKRGTTGERSFGSNEPNSSLNSLLCMPVPTVLHSGSADGVPRITPLF